MQDQMDLGLIAKEHDEVVKMAADSPAMFSKLREYQQECIRQVRAQIREARAAGKKGINILLCSPTGSGKTLIASYIIYETVRNLKRANFVVDRINLVDQTSEVFDDLRIPHGVYQADHPRRRPWERAQVCSAATMVRRKWPESDVDVIDECHTITKVVSERISKRERITLGLTATPFTKGLGLLYDALVNVCTTNELIELGFLSNFRIFAASQPNMEGVKVKGGEWDEKETSERALAVVGDCVAEYLKHCPGVKFIASAVDVEHVHALHKQFMDAGVMCATYTYQDGDDTRRDIVREFRKPDSYIRGLITVTAATKGFDVPDIGCVIMARPLRKALHEVIQFLGRGLRISPETGKTECIVLDHSGNLIRFWDEWKTFFAEGAIELDDGKKKPKEEKPNPTEKQPMKCPVCHRVHDPAPFCPQCGHEYPKKINGVQHVAGTLAEVIATGNKRQITDALWPQLCFYARTRSTDMGKAEKIALALFKQMTGDWPKDRGFSNTAPKPPTPEVLGKIKQKEIAYHKVKERERKAAQPQKASLPSRLTKSISRMIDSDDQREQRRKDRGQ